MKNGKKLENGVLISGDWVARVAINGHLPENISHTGHGFGAKFSGTPNDFQYNFVDKNGDAFFTSAHPYIKDCTQEQRNERVNKLYILAPEIADLFFVFEYEEPNEGGMFVEAKAKAVKSDAKEGK